MIIIGITGTLGAGKGTIVEYLVNKKGFVHYSVRNFIIQEIKKRSLPVNRDSMTSVANDMRKKHSPSYIAEELYNQAKKTNTDCIIESLRTPGEINALKSKGNFFLFAVDAEPRLRYERITLRKSETDSISYETFLENEKREMNSKDPDKQNLSECIKMADFVFYNNNSIEELNNQVEETLQKILHNG